MLASKRLPDYPVADPLGSRFTRGPREKQMESILLCLELLVTVAVSKQGERNEVSRCAHGTNVL
jgi:hypothetical protein